MGVFLPGKTVYPFVKRCYYILLYILPGKKARDKLTGAEPVLVLPGGFSVQLR